MVSRRVPLVAATILIIGVVAPAAAADGCPASASGFQPGPVDWEWELGDGVPAPGEDLLWDVTVVEGAEKEGLTLEQLAEMFGAGSVEELYAGVLEGWRGLDKNGDGLVCFKAFPEQGNGHPAFFSNFVDSNARASK